MLFFAFLFLLLPVLMVVLLPVGFGAQSVASLVTLPLQVIAVARDRRRRRNHALEHATVNVLEQRYGARVHIGGLAEQDGFLITGVAAKPEVILAAAREGLTRLQAGEFRLALHPRCGTTFVSGQLIASLAFLLLVILTKQFSLAWLVVALVLAWWLARPVSMFLQRYVTTSPDVGSLSVDEIVWEERGAFSALFVGGRPVRFKIRTREAPAAAFHPFVGAPATRRYRAY